MMRTFRIVILSRIGAGGGGSTSLSGVDVLTATTCRANNLLSENPLSIIQAMHKLQGLLADGALKVNGYPYQFPVRHGWHGDGV
jgi:hypothetical protein